MPLHLDYRPKVLEELFGNDAIKESILSLFAREDKPHAFLFTGPTGCGKTSVARILKDMLGCSDYDYKEYNAANTRGIDTIRDIIDSSKFAPMNGKSKVYLLDEAHQQTGAAAESLLKLLEDTPRHVYIILSTTNPERLLPTIKNRCTTYSLKPLSLREMESLLEWVLECEGFFLEENTKKILLGVADGCPRKLLVVLDQIINVEDKSPEKVQEILGSQDPEGDKVIDLCRELLKTTGGKVFHWKRVSEILKSSEMDPEGTRRAILGYMSKVILGGENDHVANIMTNFTDSFYDSGKPGLVLACYMSVNH